MCAFSIGKRLLLTGIAFLVGCTLSQASQSATQPSDNVYRIIVDARARTYVVHLPPAYVATTPMPVIIVLHGGGGNAENAMQMSGMNSIADQKGFIAVYPNGTGRFDNRLLTWNSGNCCGFALNNQVDDVKFIREMIGRLKTDFAVRSNGIYVTGMSNGGMMTYRLGCELADVLAGIAPISGALNSTPCTPTDTLAVIIFHGTADQHILYEGGVPVVQMDDHPRVDNSVKNAVSFWVSRNGCSTTPARSQVGSIIRETYTGCSEGTEVTLYTVVGGGHAWPGGSTGSLFGDVPTTRISASEVMLEFFAQHPKL